MTAGTVLEELQSRRKSGQHEALYAKRLIHRLMEEIADEHGVTVDEVKSDSQRHKVIAARWEIVWTLQRNFPQMSLAHIGRRLGVHHTTVMNILRQPGKPPRPVVRAKLTHEQREEIRALAAQSRLVVARLAHKFKVTETTIEKLLAKKPQLSPRQLSAILRQAWQYQSRRKLATRYGVSTSRIGEILGPKKERFVPIRKLTLEQATEIKRRALAGERLKDLAKEFGIHRATVGKIRLGRRWTSL